jgi:N-acetyl-gamma-glutamyl-phosphate reductase
MKKQKIGIVGFRGYSGAELVRLLSKHSSIEPVLLEHRQDSDDRPVPRGWNGPQRMPSSAESVRAGNLAAVLLATPADVSMELAPAMLDAGAKVVDLSGAFRLGTVERFQRWYKEEHKAPDLLDEAVYGLPEFCRARVAKASLVANPGCYPTAANLAIRPLLEAGLIDRTAGIICDAKSGVSGAGRKPTLKTSFCEVTGNFSAYSIFDHRHVPEVLQTSGLEESEFSFIAQLLPLDRGILETIYFRVPQGVPAAKVIEAYERKYVDEPFVRLYDPGKMPDLRSVQNTNFCDIGVKVDSATGRAIVVAAIDTLVKGAAGQAIQNLNLMLGYPESESLL